MNSKSLLSNCANLYSDFYSFKLKKNADDNRECELEEKFVWWKSGGAICQNLKIKRK
jgi:hypothetical protein